MTKENPSYKYIEDYLKEIQASGRIAVTLDELNNKFNISKKAILQNIYRLKKKNLLAQVRKGFYVIITPEYSKRGMAPYTQFIADLMAFLKREYYVGLFSAAALHGAGHQQPMEFQVIIKKPPLRSVKNKKLKISFFTTENWHQDQIIEKKTEAGYLNVSSPELTAFDLINHSRKIGGLNRIVPILEDLVEHMNASVIGRVAKSQKTPNIQRLGYILEELGNHSMAETLYRSFEKKNHRKVLLSLAHKKKTGKVNKKWSVVLNTDLEF